MDRGVGAAAGLPGSDRKDLAIQALAGSVTVSDLAARHGVSRKFVYQQTHKARTVLNDAFSSATPDGEGVVQNGRFMGYIKGSCRVPGWWQARHATRPVMRAPSRALPRRRALCTNWKKPM
jgi:hypothetical protein